MITIKIAQQGTRFANFQVADGQELLRLIRCVISMGEIVTLAHPDRYTDVDTLIFFVQNEKLTPDDRLSLWNAFQNVDKGGA